MEYMDKIRAWMDKHPREFVVIWLSRHGETCDIVDRQYPNVTETVKRAFWTQMEQKFAGLLVDHSIYSINTATLGQLLIRNMRLVVYAADYVSMTGRSRFALDSCVNLENRLGGGNRERGRDWIVNQVRQGEQTKTDFRARNRFWLASFSAAGPTAAYVPQFFLYVLPVNETDHRMECAKVFNIPNCPLFCPFGLQESTQLNNYYAGQQGMETAMQVYN